MGNYPLLCRLLGHKFHHIYAFGAESLGYKIVCCKRRHCTFQLYTYTESDVKVVGR